MIRDAVVVLIIGDAVAVVVRIEVVADPVLVLVLPFGGIERERILIVRDAVIIIVGIHMVGLAIVVDVGSAIGCHEQRDIDRKGWDIEPVQSRRDIDHLDDGSILGIVPVPLRSARQIHFDPDTLRQAWCDL